jgi:predicted ATPase
VFWFTEGFLHDKVQQSAMELIPESERSAVHALIGRHLLQRMKVEDQIDTYVFEICNQLNKARDGLSIEESEQLIELNLRAGRKALNATAFEGATGYFEVAWDMLGEDPWKTRRILALDVYLANVERLFAATQFEEGKSDLKQMFIIAIGLAEEAIQHTTSAAESIPFLLRKMDCQMSMGNPAGAFSTGMRYHCTRFI